MVLLREARIFGATSITSGYIRTTFAASDKNPIKNELKKKVSLALGIAEHREAEDDMRDWCSSFTVHLSALIYSVLVPF